MAAPGSRSLRPFGEAPAQPEGRPLAIFAKGFRPFFLGAAAFAALIVPLWVVGLDRGRLPPHFSPLAWHAHEMLFGFAIGVISGFLLTAVGNWTQHETATGWTLAGLFALWCLGRVAVSAPWLFPTWGVAAIDLSFLPALTMALGRPLILAGNRRNVVMILLLLALFGTNLGMHLETLGIARPFGGHAPYVAIDLVILLVTIISGRVFPMFTRNATGHASIRNLPAWDRATALGMAILTLADAFDTPAPWPAILSGAVAFAAAARMRHWGTWHARREPLLWILHVGYAWVPLGLALRAIALFAPLPAALWVHALTAGAIGSLCLGMMARVTLGHTGRSLQTPKGMGVAFAGVTLASALRVWGPEVAPSWTFGAIASAGVLWCLSFATYTWVFAPMLVAARVDGKAG